MSLSTEHGFGLVSWTWIQTGFIGLDSDGFKDVDLGLAFMDKIGFIKTLDWFHKTLDFVFIR